MVRKAWLVALVVLPLLSVFAVVRTTDAAFVATTASTGNQFQGDSLQPPSSVTATHQCVLTIRSVRLDWSASPTTWATHYRVLRSVNGGGYSSVATVAYGTNTWTDNSVSGSTTYVYRVRAERTGWTWTSAEAQSNSVTTPSLCL